MKADDTSGLLPTDDYSLTLQRVRDNPGRLETRPSTIDLQTLLGHSETWILQSIRVEDGTTVFLQRLNAAGGMRLVVPPEVVAAISRQADVLVTKSLRRGAQRSMETKREKGIPIGNPAALKAARKQRRK